MTTDARSFIMAISREARSKRTTHFYARHGTHRVSEECCVEFQRPLSRQTAINVQIFVISPRFRGETCSLNSRFSFVIFADLILWSVHAGEDGAEQRLERPIAKERTENSEDNIGLP